MVWMLYALGFSGLDVLCFGGFSVWMLRDLDASCFGSFLVWMLRSLDALCFEVF